MSKREHLLVSLAREKYEGKVTLNVSSQCKELQPSTSSSSSPKVSIKENEQTDYFTSLIKSNESDYDDSDKNPNFELPANNTKPFLHSIIPSSTSSSTSSSSSASSINDSSNSSSDTENENVDLSQILLCLEFKSLSQRRKRERRESENHRCGNQKLQKY